VVDDQPLRPRGARSRVMVRRATTSRRGRGAPLAGVPHQRALLRLPGYRSAEPAATLGVTAFPARGGERHPSWTTCAKVSGCVGRATHGSSTRKGCLRRGSSTRSRSASWLGGLHVPRGGWTAPAAALAASYHSPAGLLRDGRLVAPSGRRRPRSRKRGSRPSPGTFPTARARPGPPAARRPLARASS
jgi:hypothetical protein